MNYESIKKLKLDENMSIAIKNKGKLNNIEITLEIDKYNDTSFDKIEQIIHQINSESVCGFFELYENQLFFNLLLPQKVNEATLMRSANIAVASMVSLNKMLEVLIDERG